MKLKEYIFSNIESFNPNYITIYATNKAEAEYIFCQFADIRKLQNYRLVKTKYKGSNINYLIDKYGRAEDVVKAQYEALDNMRAMHGK